MNLENRKAGERETRPTPETDAAFLKLYAGYLTHPATIDLQAAEKFARNLERQRDELQEQCNINAKQLLDTVNDRNSLGVQLDLLRDEFRRIEARIGESGLGDNPYLSHIADYCQRAQKDIAVRYTPIEERDRACERLAVVSLQLDDCKSQRDRLLEALKALIDTPDYRNLSEFSQQELAAWAEARQAVAAVEGSAS